MVRRNTEVTQMTDIIGAAATGKREPLIRAGTNHGRHANNKQQLTATAVL